MKQSDSPESSIRARRPGCSWVEAAALSILVAIVAVIATFKILETRVDQLLRFSSPGEVESRALEKYGPDRNSLGFEEWIVRDYFQDRRGGTFLDVGANHYRVKNNTYYLETSLGWSGIAIDALEEFAADYATHRPNTRFVAMFASDVSDSTAELFVPENNLISSVSREFTQRYGEAGKPRQVPTTTLTHLLDQAGITSLDYMTMDIELAEPKALAGFDINRFQPKLVCIESHPEVRQQLLDYFYTHGYVVVGKYLRVDPHNLYFKPAVSHD